MELVFSKLHFDLVILAITIWKDRFSESGWDLKLSATLGSSIVHLMLFGGDPYILRSLGPLDIYRLPQNDVLLGHFCSHSQMVDALGNVLAVNKDSFLPVLRLLAAWGVFLVEPASRDLLHIILLGILLVLQLLKINKTETIGLAIRSLPVSRTIHRGSLPHQIHTFEHLSLWASLLWALILVGAKVLIKPVRANAILRLKILGQVLPLRSHIWVYLDTWMHSHDSSLLRLQLAL